MLRVLKKPDDSEQNTEYVLSLYNVKKEPNILKKEHSIRPKAASNM